MREILVRSQSTLKDGDILDIIDFNAYIDDTKIMANLTIRDLPDTAKESLRVQAAKAGVSLESFARGLLQEASKKRSAQPEDLLKLSQECFGPKNGVDLELSPAKTRRPVVEFD